MAMGTRRPIAGVLVLLILTGVTPSKAQTMIPDVNSSAAFNVEPTYPEELDVLPSQPAPQSPHMVSESEGYTEPLNIAMEKKLKKTLFEKYDPTIRPAPNFSSPVPVDIGMALNLIVNLDEKQQALTTHIWVRIKWKDAFVKWNPSEYGGIKSITMHNEDVWVPDLVVYNDGGDGFGDRDSYPVRYQQDGTALWPFPSVLLSECTIMVTKFPFDYQTCVIKIGSWIYNGLELDLNPLPGASDLLYYGINGQWKLCGMPVSKTTIYYHDGVKTTPVPFPDVSFTLQMKRRAAHHVINIILPSLSIIGVGLFAFFLPVESGEKASLVVTVLLALTVFLLVIVDSLPNNSVELPVIGVYLTAIIALMGLATGMTVIVIYFHHRGNRQSPIPAPLKFAAFHIIAPLTLNFQIRAKYRKQEELKRRQKNGHPQVMKNMAAQLVKATHQTKIRLSSEGSPDENAVIALLRSIKELLASAQQDKIARAEEWFDLSAVMDRLFLFIFVLVTAIMTIWFLAHAHDYHECEDIGKDDALAYDSK